MPDPCRSDRRRTRLTDRHPASRTVRIPSLPVTNGNGIVATPNGKSLIIGYWYGGALYRLALVIGEIRKIAAPVLASTDGITGRGNTLYITRSVNNEVDTVRLSSDATPAAVVSTRTYRGADTATGVAVSRDQRYLQRGVRTRRSGTPCRGDCRAAQGTVAPG
jgi:hypothetical protein